MMIVGKRDITESKSRPPAGFLNTRGPVPSPGGKGISLIETVIALGILGFIGVGFLSAYYSGFLGTAKVDEYIMAESLARSQMEYIKSQPYLDSYEVTVTCPQEYEVSPIIVEDVTPDQSNTLQKVTVTILRNGRVALKLEGYKHKPKELP